MLFGSDNFNNYLASVLFNYDAENTRFQFQRTGEAVDGRHRVTFVIKNKQSAIKCYSDFTLKKSLVQGARYKIYLRKSEEILVKWGDILS